MKVKRLCWCIFVVVILIVVNADASAKAIALQPSTFGGVVDSFGRFTNSIKVGKFKPRGKSH